VATTFLQVLSRIVVLVVATHARSKQGTWHAGLAVLAWALVEVPRYAFYVSNLLQDSVPFPLFWLRYSLFIVLYPAGITGEWFTLRAALPALKMLPLPLGARIDARGFTKALLLIYFVAGPFMVWNMWANRAAAMKKRCAKPPPPEVGVVFPPDGKGGRTTTRTSQRAIAAALAGCGGEDAADAAAAARADKAWKFSYPRHYRALVQHGAASPEAARASAQAGLDWCHKNFEFVPTAGEPAVPFADATAPAAARLSFHTGTLKGGGARPDAFSVPFNGAWAPGMPLDVPAGATLSGAALDAQLATWVAGGIMEADAGEAIKWTSGAFGDGGDGPARLARTHFVMIGAGSAMGPFRKLVELGAHVVALDVNFPDPKTRLPQPWTRLLDTVSRSPGRVTFPTKEAPPPGADAAALAKIAGCSVIEQPAEIGKWLVDWAATLPAGDRVCIGNYTYLDGDRHVKLALGCDAVMAALRKARPSTALAFLCTPTDVHVATREAVEASRTALGAGLGSFGLEAAARLLSGGRALVPNALPPVRGPGGTSVHLVDGLSTDQSFNYALAKRIQHWRAAVEFEAGATVSSMVAPSTATISVIHNKTFAWAYGGMPHFGFEIFKQDTTNAVMTAVLLNDVLNEQSPKNPKNRKSAGVNTALELFRTEAVHGGLWRSPYKVDSLGPTSVLIYFGSHPLFVAGFAAALYAVKIATNKGWLPK